MASETSQVFPERLTDLRSFEKTYSKYSKLSKSYESAKNILKLSTCEI